MNNLSSLLLLLAVLAAVSADNIMPTFQDHVKEHGKKFTDENEMLYRQSVYDNNVKEMIRNNNDPRSTHKEYPNQFTTMTSEEFESTMLRAIPPKKEKNTPAAPSVGAATPVVGAWAPIDVDWTSLGKVTAVKNQGNCGGCWAFSAVAAIESLTYIKNNTAKDYSEQQLISCSTGNSGCGGGSTNTAFTYIKGVGLLNESFYPFTSFYGANGACLTAKITPANVAVNISGYLAVSYSCSAVAGNLTARPLSVAVNATAWQRYSSGILSSCANNTSVNHGVLLVGISTSAAGSYWKIKNSWGTGWGEAGFIRIATFDGTASSCMVCNYASYPY